MSYFEQSTLEVKTRVDPLCPVFGICGGCAYQDRSYEEELDQKETALRRFFSSELNLEENRVYRIIPSPEAYHYRHRLDVGIYRRKSGEVAMGFMKEGAANVVPIEACFIARKEVSDFLPELKRQALEKLPPKYRTANLVVRTGDDGRIAWGGIGKRSLDMNEQDYFWTLVHGKKIFYALDTFFQANLYILDSLIHEIQKLNLLDQETTFFDLYAGVGLFGVCLADAVKEVVMIEDNPTSVRVAHYNLRYHGLEGKAKVVSGKVEDQLTIQLRQSPGKKVAIIDPPRKGLQPQVIESFVHAVSGKEDYSLQSVLYLSCHPESLMRDLKIFLSHGWKINRVIPFDFFPRTQHVETLALFYPPVR